MGTDDPTYDHGKVANEQAVANANATLRSLLLINGGAAVALLAFIGSLISANAVQLAPSIDLLTAPLMWFAWGVAASVLGMAFAYLTNYSIAGHAFALYGQEAASARRWLRSALTFQVLAVLVAIASLACFVLGILAIRTAVNMLVSP